MLNLFTLRNLAIVSTVTLLGACATPGGSGSVTKTIASTPELSTFSTLITKSGMSETLNGTGPFTVFAPNNQAFAVLPAKKLAELELDQAKLKALVSYHVASEKLAAADLKGKKIKTLNGASVGATKAGDYVIVEDAVVQKADLAAGNGVVHIIDAVLIPASK